MRDTAAALLSAAVALLAGSACWWAWTNVNISVAGALAITGAVTLVLAFVCLAVAGNESSDD